MTRREEDGRRRGRGRGRGRGRRRTRRRKKKKGEPYCNIRAEISEGDIERLSHGNEILQARHIR